MYSHLSFSGDQAETLEIMTHSESSLPPHTHWGQPLSSISVFGGHFTGMFSHGTPSRSLQLWSMLKWPFCYNGISDLECFFFNVWIENKQVQMSYSFWNLGAAVEVSPAVSLLWLPGPEVEGWWEVEAAGAGLLPISLGVGVAQCIPWHDPVTS